MTLEKTIKLLDSEDKGDNKIAWEFILKDDDLADKIFKIAFLCGNCPMRDGDYLNEILGIKSFERFYYKVVNEKRIQKEAYITKTLKKILDAK